VHTQLKASARNPENGKTAATFSKSSEEVSYELQPGYQYW
jgi:hypothetical protein